MKQIIVQDMQAYVNEMRKSFAMCRSAYSDYRDAVELHGYEYTKENFVRAKYPRFPLRLRKEIINLI